MEQDKFGFGEIFDNCSDSKVRKKWESAEDFEDWFKKLQEGK